MPKTLFGYDHNRKWPSLQLSSSGTNEDMQPCRDGNARIGGSTMGWTFPDETTQIFEGWVSARLHVNATSAANPLSTFQPMQMCSFQEMS